MEYEMTNRQKQIAATTAKAFEKMDEQEHTHISGVFVNRESPLINTCAITGITLQKEEGKPGNLVAHHLYNLTAFPHLSVIPENGVLLTATLHTQFHKNYGYKNNTLPQFQEFLLFLIDSLQKSKNELMPISSQANLKKLEGSETRAYDRDKVMKLYKRLEEIDKFLATIKRVM